MKLKYKIAGVKLNFYPAVCVLIIILMMLLTLITLISIAIKSWWSLLFIALFLLVLSSIEHIAEIMDW